jgi:hypothetical protein
VPQGPLDGHHVATGPDKSADVEVSKVVQPVRDADLDD